MRILIVGQYFWPENFRINDLALGLKERGHEVMVFTGKPNFPGGSFFEGYSMFGKSKESWNGITIYRAPLIQRGNGKGLSLIINYLSFAFFGSIKALFLDLKADIVLVYQQSPVILALPGVIFKKKNSAKLFLYVQDLWPESVLATTQIRNKFIIGSLDRFTRWLYRKSDTILIQSLAFRDFLLNRDVPAQKIVYLPNSAEGVYRKEDKRPDLAHFFKGSFHIVFAGTIGAAQDLKILIAAAKKVKAVDAGISWVIIGDGRKKEELMELAVKEGVADVCRFTGFFPLEEMPFFFAYADAMLVSLKKELIFSLTIPAKLQSYMACSKPVISALDGEGSRIIEEAGCGFTGPSGDAEILAANVIAIKNMTQDKRNELGNRGYVYFQREFERNVLLAKLEKMLSA